MKIIKLNEKGKTLSTRDLGREIRNQISDFFKDGFFVRLELEGVELFSSGFADELFGKLSVEHTSDFIRSNLKVIYPSNEKEALLLRNLIVKAVIDRKNKSKEEIL